MNFEARQRIIEDLESIERRFTVDAWKIRGVHIWPLLKLGLFFHLFYQSQAVKEVKAGRRRSRIQIATRQTKEVLSAAIYLLRLRIKKSNFIFTGASSHRVTWQGNSFNRYFDPLMDYLSGEQSYLLEYDKGATMPYKPERVIYLAKLLPLFRRKYDFAEGWKALTADKDFVETLELIRERHNVQQVTVKQQLFTALKAVLNWERLYSYMIDKTHASMAFGLCYYNHQVFGMNLAASRKGVISVDMQHGSQGTMHPGYTYARIPTDGYNVLPNVFWCWDADSTNHIESWTRGFSAHRAIRGGNPWITFLSKAAENEFSATKTGRPVIVYTLQPLAPVLENWIMDAIKETSDEFEWWIRFHPRMTESDVNDVQSAFKQAGIFERSNFNEANSLPLPLILKFAKVHISKYSGAIAEAALMGVISIIVDKIGAEMFMGLIGEGLAIDCSTNNASSLKDCLRRVVDMNERTDGGASVDYAEVLNILSAGKTWKDVQQS